MKKNIKILISYHKPDVLLKDDILTPIHVGRAQQANAVKGDNKDYFWMLENMIGDDTGDNISEKNASYNEMTAIYWAWKNYDVLGNPDYIGHMHYRRHFIFDEIVRKPLIKCYKFDNKNYFKKINYSYENVYSILKDYDFIYTQPFYRKTVYEHYKENHKIEDLDTVIEIIKEKYPQFIKAADKYLNGSNSYFYNMFIIKKDLFFDYSKWIFDILSEFENRVDITDKRLFISERLTGIYITHLLDKGYKGKPLSTMYIEGINNIPVVFSTDENYAKQTCVAMISILMNSKTTSIYDFHLFVPAGFSQKTADKINSIKLKYENCSITYHRMDNSFDGMKITIPHITLPTYYRLKICELLPQYGKCIYLDSDIIATKDLTEFFNINIDDFYIAGVKAPGYHVLKNHNMDYAEKIGLPSIKQYINAGVLLLNLKKMRKDNLTGVFMDLAKKDFPSQDQDILNIACYDNIKFLPLKYNNMYSKYVKKAEQLHQVFSRQEIDEAIRQPVIIHYCDKIKPWQDITCLNAKTWWDYAKKTPFFNGLLNENAENILNNSIALYNKEKKLCSYIYC